MTEVKDAGAPTAPERTGRGSGKGRGLLVVLVVAALVAVGVAVWTLRPSPTDGARDVVVEYLDAIAVGDAARANGLMDPEYDPIELGSAMPAVRDGRTNEAMAGAETITDPTVSEGRERSDGEFAFDVTYRLDGERHESTLTVHDTGEDLMLTRGLAQTYQIWGRSEQISTGDRGLFGPWAFTVGEAEVEPLPEDSDEINTVLALYPGVYDIAPTGGDLLRGVPGTFTAAGVDPVWDEERVVLTFEPTERFEEEFTELATADLEECLHRTRLLCTGIYVSGARDGEERTVHEPVAWSIVDPPVRTDGWCDATATVRAEFDATGPDGRRTAQSEEIPVEGLLACQFESADSMSIGDHLGNTAWTSPPR
ncbi:hypothetical protein [Georgenia alba]|uniref:Uncharacterized protein n=1 Tax=Georgenia alba TaxID=2233858 RepID=A0ABW2Q262_9MICO